MSRSRARSVSRCATSKDEVVVVPECGPVGYDWNGCGTIGPNQFGGLIESFFTPSIFNCFNWAQIGLFAAVTWFAALSFAFSSTYLAGATVILSGFLLASYIIGLRMIMMNLQSLLCNLFARKRFAWFYSGWEVSTQKQYDDLGIQMKTGAYAVNLSKALSGLLSKKGECCALKDGSTQVYENGTYLIIASVSFTGLNRDDRLAPRTGRSTVSMGVATNGSLTPEVSQTASLEWTHTVTPVVPEAVEVELPFPVSVSCTQTLRLKAGDTVSVILASLAANAINTRHIWERDFELIPVAYQLTLTKVD